MKSFKLFGYVVVMGLALTGSLAQAGTLTVPTMFSNNAVLQRGMAVPVFGTATAGASVTVTLFSATSPPNTIRTKTTTAAADGKWQVKLEAMEALTGNNTLVISSRIDENDTYINMIHTEWGEGLKRVFAQIPNPQWDDAG